MKHFVGTILLVLIGFSLSTTARAQTTTPATSTEPSVATSTEEVASSTPATSTPTVLAEPEPVLTPPTRTGTPQVLTSTLQKRVINLAANVSNRLDATTNRFINIAKRLERRLTKLTAQDFDTSAAATHLQTARAQLASITTTMSAIDEQVYSAATSEAPHEAWPRVKNVFRNVRTDIQAVQDTLRLTLLALKEARPKAAESAATTTDQVPDIVN